MKAFTNQEDRELTLNMSQKFTRTTIKGHQA